jgi:hypothetical protein
LTTVPVGLGAFGRIPLGPLVAGRPPTRNGSLSIDRARPSTKVVQPATTSIAAAQAIAALAKVTAVHPRAPAGRRRFRPRLSMTNLIPTGLHGSIKGTLL